MFRNLFNSIAHSKDKRLEFAHAPRRFPWRDESHASSWMWSMEFINRKNNCERVSFCALKRPDQGEGVWNVWTVRCRLGKDQLLLEQKSSRPDTCDTAGLLAAMYKFDHDMREDGHVPVLNTKGNYYVWARAEGFAFDADGNVFQIDPSMMMMKDTVITQAHLDAAAEKEKAAQKERAFSSWDEIHDMIAEKIPSPFPFEKWAGWTGYAGYVRKAEEMRDYVRDIPASFERGPLGKKEICNVADDDPLYYGELLLGVLRGARAIYEKNFGDMEQGEKLFSALNMLRHQAAHIAERHFGVSSEKAKTISDVIVTGPDTTGRTTPLAELLEKFPPNSPQVLALKKKDAAERRAVPDELVDVFSALLEIFEREINKGGSGNWKKHGPRLPRL